MVAKCALPCAYLAHLPLPGSRRTLGDMSLSGSLLPDASHRDTRPLATAGIKDKAQQVLSGTSSGPWDHRRRSAESSMPRRHSVGHDWDEPHGGARAQHHLRRGGAATLATGRLGAFQAVVQHTPTPDALNLPSRGRWQLHPSSLLGYTP